MSTLKGHRPGDSISAVFVASFAGEPLVLWSCDLLRVMIVMACDGYVENVSPRFLTVTESLQNLQDLHGKQQ
jgi:hypothetical protein